jgi:two-component system sensor histidine kinase UhpB
VRASGLLTGAIGIVVLAGWWRHEPNAILAWPTGAGVVLVGLGSLLACQPGWLDGRGRRRAEDGRRALIERNGAIVRALGQIAYEWRPATNELHWDGDYTHRLGYNAAEMGQDTASWTSRVHPDDLDAVLAEVEASSRERRCYDLEYRFRHRDGRFVWMHDRGVTFVSPDGRLERIVGVFTDITERKQTRERLRDYARQLQQASRRLIETEDTERRAISRELHDRIGQNLVALTINLAIVRSQLPEDVPPAVNARLDDTQALLKATVDEVRNVMAELRPAALDDHGLPAALNVYARRLAERLGVPVTVHGDTIEPRPPIATETALFRIAQEALNNVAKHARASRVEVTVAAGPHHVSLTVRDDGVGFDAGQPRAGTPAYGMFTMRERAEAVGATLRVESSPGRGTRVVVEVARAEG